MKLSKLYAMQIESENKKRRGYILSISCVGCRIDGFTCSGPQEGTFYARAEKSKLTAHGVTFLSVGAESEGAYRIMLGRAVYSAQGKFLGHLTDCTIKGKTITEANVGKSVYPFADLVFGDVIILKDGKALAEMAAKDMLIAALCSAESPK